MSFRAERGIFLELRARFVSNCTTPQQADGYQNMGMRIDPKGVTPECVNRGSSSGLAWIPTVREPHRPEGNRGIEAFGNDGL